MYIILGEKHQSYTHALKVLAMDPLFKRRQKMCRTFAKKCLKRNERKTVIRGDQPKFCQVRSRTVRFEKSAIGHMTELLKKLKQAWQWTTVTVNYRGIWRLSWRLCSYTSALFSVFLITRQIRHYIIILYYIIIRWAPPVYVLLCVCTSVRPSVQCAVPSSFMSIPEGIVVGVWNLYVHSDMSN